MCQGRKDNIGKVYGYHRQHEISKETTRKLREKNMPREVYGTVIRDTTEFMELQGNKRR